MIHDYLKKTLVFILAGGQGERLYPLTRDRSKPAVPFGGIYRIIDFPLSNSINADLKKIIVLTQYKSLSLDRHIKTAWNIYSRELDGFIDVVPPQQRIDSNWYAGTADALFQNIYIIEMEKPEFVLILSGDHVYKMDYRKMLLFHLEKNADLTVAAIEIPVEEARRFGVIEVDDESRIVGFEEKPEHPKSVPHKENMAFISMGIYAFKTEKLVSYLSQNYKRDGSSDFGRDILPGIDPTERVYAFDYVNSQIDNAYWRDIGTIRSYFEANMDLISVTPQLNLYDREWPIRTYMEQSPPAKSVFDSEERRGLVIDSIISNGAIISGSITRRCVISPGVKVNSYAEVEDSILMNDVSIGRHARIRNAIIDKYVQVPANEVVGYNDAEDKKRFTVSADGIVIIHKNYIF